MRWLNRFSFISAFCACFIALVMHDTPTEMHTLFSPHRKAIQNLLDAAPTDLLFADSARRPLLQQKLRAFYTKRNFHPAWILKHQRELFDSLCVLLQNADAEGLDLDAYWIPALISIRKQLDSTPSLPRTALLDIASTAAFMSYAIHVSAGTIDPSSIDNTWMKQRQYPDVAAVLAEAIEQHRLGSSIETLMPQTVEYLRVKILLQRYHALHLSSDWPSISARHPLAQGDRGAVVSMLRKRLLADGWLASRPESQPDLFDRELADAVADFQAHHGLKADGVVGTDTRAALNVPLAWRLQQINVNLDRIRWLKDNPNSSYIQINIPEFLLRVKQREETVLLMKIIAGWRLASTPVFNDSLGYIIFKPTWTVPQSVAREEMLPRLRQKPPALSPDSFIIYRGWGPQAPRIDPGTVYWDSVDYEAMDSFKIVQLPGPTNPLGSVKFAMTNAMDIYLHATPEVHLFTYNNRDMSHGCIRLEEPLKLCRYLMQGMSGWDSTTIVQAMNDSTNQIVKLPRHIKVHIVYHTVFVDNAGVQNFMPDVYSRDSLQILLRGRLDSLSRLTCVSMVKFNLVY